MLPEYEHLISARILIEVVLSKKGPHEVFVLTYDKDVLSGDTSVNCTQE